MPIEIIITDDHQLFTEGLSALFENDPDVHISHIFSNGRTFLENISNMQADILLLDLKMPEMSGLEILKELKKRDIKMPVIILSTYSDVPTVLECKKIGASGYLLKNTGKIDFKQALMQVLHGRKVFPSLDNSSQTLLEKFQFSKLNYKITKREWEIIQLIKLRYTNQKISDELHLSIYTVETHRKNIMQKLDIKSPINLINFIQENEW